MPRISPVWLLLSGLFALFAALAPKSVPLPWVVAGLMFGCTGAYLVGRAEEYYAVTHSASSIYERLRHPMYTGSFLMLLGAALALKSLFAVLCAIIWGLIASYLGWIESHSDPSAK